MNIISVKSVSSCLLLGVCLVSSIVAQSDWLGIDSTGSSSLGTDPFGGDPFGGMIDTAPPAPLAPTSTSKTAQQKDETVKKAELPFSGATSREAVPVINTPSKFQNAIIEGIQLTSEKSETSDEKIVSCYFIFRDKPSFYFYDINVREKKLTFEFHDTRTGSSPVPTVSEAPIKGFTIESGKVDVNKEVKGLMPEWHDLIKVVFDLEEVPKIHVSDEYSIISFSFKWSSDPKKLKNYSVRDNSRKVMVISVAGVGGAALGALGYFLLKPEPEPQVDLPIPIDDLPIHTTGVQ